MCLKKCQKTNKQTKNIAWKCFSQEEKTKRMKKKNPEPLPSSPAEFH